MPVVPVPPGATPGVINTSTLIPLEALCNVGSRQGTRDGSVDAWVQVVITPAGDAPPTPDAWGRFLHVCIEFVQPDDWTGKRRRQVPAWSYNDGPSSMFVESDPGWFWIGSWARFHATGGTPGDKYNITMTTVTAKQESDARMKDGDADPFQVDVFEPPCKFRLSALSTATGDNPNPALPGFAQYHSLFRLVRGQATWGGVPVAIIGGATGKSSWLPLNVPITTAVTTVYQTAGAV